MSAIAEAAASRDLHVGLAFGALATGAVVGVTRLRRVPVAVVTGALAAAAAWTTASVGWTVVALAGLAGAAAVPTPRRTPAVALLTAGIVGLAGSAPSPTAGAFLAAAVVVAAPAFGGVVRAQGRPLTAALLAVSIAGIWAAVPDTEEILLVGGVLAVPLLATMVGGLDRLDAPWSLPASAAVVGPVVWAAVHGGRGRPGSMVGGVACLGVLLVEPVARRLARGPGPTRAPAAVAGVLLVVQVAVVLVTARVAAAQADVGPAALVATAALTAGTAVVSLTLLALRRG